MLKTLAEITEGVGKFSSASTKAELAAMQAEWKPNRDAIKDLLTVSKATISRLATAVTQAKAAAQRESKIAKLSQTLASDVQELPSTKRKGAKPGAADANSPADVFDAAMECASQVGSVSISASTPASGAASEEVATWTLSNSFDVAKPVIIRVPIEVDSTEEMKEHLRSFKASFRNSMERAKKGRKAEEIGDEKPESVPESLVKIFNAVRDNQGMQIVSSDKYAGKVPDAVAKCLQPVITATRLLSQLERSAKTTNNECSKQICSKTTNSKI